MRWLSGKIDPAEGPVLSVSIGNSSAYEKAPGFARKRLSRRLLIDTGASYSVVERSVTAELGIKTEQSPGVPFKTDIGKGKAWRHRADMSFELSSDEGGTLTMPFVLIYIEQERGHFSDHGFIGLLGRDLLNQMKLHYDGP